MNINKIISVSIFLICLSFYAYAQKKHAGFDIVYLKNDISKAVTKSLPTILEISKNDLILNSIKTANKNNMSLKKIKLLDIKWRTSPDSDILKQSIIKKRVSLFLRSKVVYDKNEMFSEIFITGIKGTTVGTYPLTSDFRQSDEKKWIKSFNKGKCRISIGPLVYDKSSDRMVFHVSVPVLNKKKKCIGILTAGVRNFFLQKTKT